MRGNCTAQMSQPKLLETKVRDLFQLARTRKLSKAWAIFALDTSADGMAQILNFLEGEDLTTSLRICPAVCSSSNTQTRV